MAVTPLPWQLERWQKIVELQRSDKLAHAILIAGPKGVGKSQFAEALIARTLCQKPEIYACGECHSCRMFSAGYHPDLIRVTTADKSRQIRVDSIRQVNTFVSQTAQQGGSRVIHIKPAELMNVAASNALLKSLEEPGSRTLFILESSVPSRLLATIRSRCQAWNFPTPPVEESLKWLNQRLGHSEETAFWLRAASNIPFLAEELASAEMRQLRQDLRELFDALVRGGEPVHEAARLDSQKVDQILWFGIVWLEDLIRLGLSGEKAQVRNSDLLPLYQQAVKNARVRDWFKLLDFALEQRNLLAVGANPNPQLVLESWLVRWAALLRS